MNKNILFIAALAATLSLAACDDAKKSAEEAAAAADSLAMEAINDVQEGLGVAEYVGTFEGTIAQADGAGFVTSLVLNQDLTYSMTQAANGGEAAAETENGTYTVSEDGAIITLTNAADNSVKTLKYENSTVIMLGADGTVPAEPSVYTLNKKVVETAAAIAENAADAAKEEAAK